MSGGAGGQGRLWGSKGTGGKGNCSWNVLHERISFLKCSFGLSDLCESCLSIADVPVAKET